MDTNNRRVTEAEALEFHSKGKPGKIEITPTKPLTSQRDLSLAYSPGVAYPCLHIARDPATAYDYTSKGNLVAVISNGTAVLGLGDLGALASKPVMEGKAVLFKRFADIDSIDLEVSTSDVDEFVNCVRYLGVSFGGINLEDIKAPECFIIEQRLRELCDIPVFHDDQHGTAIIAAAGLINACNLTDRDFSTLKVVVNGAGAASIACIELAKAMGVAHDNVIMCDTKGVIYQGRTEGMNQWKSAHAAVTDRRTLAEALDGADAFLGLSVKGAVTQEMIQKMAPSPIIFAMANPDPEITPEDVKAVRPDALVATGRSDYPNQVNNVLGFPYIFRGALDVRASTINESMKIAAAEALAALAREDVPDEVSAAYSGRHLSYGPEYLIPAPFDPRLISHVPVAVAKAAMDSGVARRPILDLNAYARQLAGRMNPIAASLQGIFESVRRAPKRVVFAEGEEEKVIRAAQEFRGSGYGQPVLVGREDVILEKGKSLGLSSLDGLEIHNARLSHANQAYTEFLFKRLQRSGYLYRDCQRMVNQDRNVFAACMVAMGDADALVTGTTRSWRTSFDEITRVLDPLPNRRAFGLTMLVARGRTVFIADTNIHEELDGAALADIAVQAADAARRMGTSPRVALLSFSSFADPSSSATAHRMHEAVEILDRRIVDFEYDGELAADIALDYELMRRTYPFCRLTGPANVLIMPDLNSSNISSKVLQHLGGGTVIGPMLTGLSKPAQIVEMGATVTDIVNLAAIAAHDSGN